MPALDGVMRWLRRSLVARAMVLSLVLSTVTSVIVFGLVSLRISSELFRSRSDTVVGLSSTAIEQIRSMGLASTAQDEQGLQTLKASMLRSAESLSGSQQVALLHTEGENAVISSPDLISASLDVQSIPQQLRDQVAAAPEAVFWQSVRGGDGQPAVIVGAAFTMPLSGQQEIYIEHTLAPEQHTLEFVQWMLALAAGLLVLSSVGITVLSATAILRPIRRTVAVSTRLAEGDLGQRLPTTGADEAVRLGRSFNRMADSLERQITELRRLSTLQRRFVSDVSHELRTPITTIRLAAEVVNGQRDELAEPGRRSAEILLGQVERFERLLADLLETSRIDAGAVTLSLTCVDLVALVRQVALDCEPIARERRAPITVTADPAVIDVQVDTGRITRAVRNLLSNALEHGAGHPIAVRVDTVGAGDAGARPAGELLAPAAAEPGCAAADVSAEPGGDAGGGGRLARIRVTDAGPGIAPEDLGHVFDRFWRADASRQRTLGGTGLGLSITREDVRLHGGTVIAASRQGHGATFTILLPLDAAGAAADPLAEPIEGGRR